MTSPTRPGRGGGLVGSLLERRYRVDALIARGGMSTVYRGLDTRLQRPVAIKVMDPQYSGDRKFTERFEWEARAAASLYHPDIVAVYDQGVDHSDDADHVFLVMQLVEGGTLRDLINELGRLPLPLALTVMEPVLAALSAAHEAGMVHRDIKPENVLISRDGSVKVADFGLVRAAASAGTTSGSVILGTVAYLSPEQVTTGAADARTDIYAAGVVLYELLTGTPPYQGDTALSVAYQHVNNDVPAPSDRVAELPAPVDDLVLRATRRDASVRPPDAAAFLADLQRVRSQLGLPAVPVPVPQPEQEVAEPRPDDPPTEQFAAVPSTADHDPGGPRRPRALLRPTANADQPQDFAAADSRRPDPFSSGEQRRRSRRVFGGFALAVLLIAALLGGTAWWLGSGRYIAVPHVEGQPVAAAQSALRKAELVPAITRQLNDTVAEGTVISSSPKPGARALRGDKVQLVVSLGRPKVPAIAQGAPVEQAQRALRDAKLQPKLDEAANEFDATVPEGRVLSLDPAPGTALPIRSTVTIAVSKGPPPAPVPDVRGLSRDEAFAALSQAGFAPFEAGRQFAFTVDPDHVISTDPAGGTEVRMSGRPRVGVVLSNSVVVPQLSGLRVVQAQQQAAALGLNLSVQSFWQRPDSLIFGQFPPPGTRVSPGSTVHVTAF